MKELFLIENRVEVLPVLASKMEELAETWGLSMPLTMNLNLVLEEAVSNIIFYAYNDNEKHEIQISLSLDPKGITIQITDDGKPFDPTSIPKPDITLPAEERPIGGLGIFLISKLMDSVHYLRQDNLNILTLIKNT